MWIQQEILLSARPRGFHLITHETMENLSQVTAIQAGILHLFIKHTSASLTINENADPSVRADLESHFNKFAPEGADYYLHTDEGDDDMPAHIKNCILGSSLTIPISNGSLNMGIWQGIYLCEHRNNATGRQLLATIHGHPYT
ncbi:MAG: secondary thiamine-phosphate synthase enzyme YjbQ [Methylococcales bacterium]